MERSHGCPTVAEFDVAMPPYRRRLGRPTEPVVVNVLAADREKETRQALNELDQGARKTDPQLPDGRSKVCGKRIEKA